MGSHDAGKKVANKKCHILVDAVGYLLGAAVQAGDIRDRFVAGLFLDKKARILCIFIERIPADTG